MTLVCGAKQTEIIIEYYCFVIGKEKKWFAFQSVKIIVDLSCMAEAIVSLMPDQTLISSLKMVKILWNCDG